MSDQDRISPYDINTISSRIVMRLEKNINKEIISWLNTEFSELNLKNCMKYSKKNYWWNLGSERVNLVLRDFTLRWLEVHSKKSA